MSSVRDTVFDLMRRMGMTRIFSNPGSTEIPFLIDLPGDFEFVLGLHEGSVVSMAAGHALMDDAPAFVLLHTTAGLGNAVSALATARVNQAPLVVVVGQQDRRHLAQEPFLAGRLAGLAGDYPLEVHEPVRAADVPGTIRQAHAEATTGRGPVLVVVPMDDWLASAPEPHEVFGPAAVLRPDMVDENSVAAVAQRLEGSRTPALVVGAGADGRNSWRALTELAERLQSPVWQEAFSSRAGFPQDHPLFAGQLPAERGAVRAALREHDLVLVVGAGVFRQYQYAPGPLVEPGTVLLLVSADADEIHRSPVDLAVLATPAAFCAALASHVAVSSDRAAPPRRDPAPTPPAAAPLRAEHVLAVLASAMDPETVLFEEAPSDKGELHRRLLIRRPHGFVTPAMGGLGFSLPAAIGVRMAQPQRPVIAVLGDGSAIYGIQGLWTAVHYDIGLLFVVLANGRYAIMDELAARAEGHAPWPGLDEISVSALARGFGCEAITIETHQALRAAIAEVVPGLARRSTPLLLEAVVTAGTT